MIRLTAAVILGAAAAGAALGHTRGLRSGMAIGYAYGDRDGQRRGDANARLDMVPAAPASHALLNGTLHDHVTGEATP
jgi:hypothetical protein